MKGVWFWSGIAAIGGALMLGLILVWVNIELVDLSYHLKSLQQELGQKKDLKAKLEVERNNLIAPYRLRQMAKEYGLKPADPDEVRTLAH